MKTLSELLESDYQRKISKISEQCITHYNIYSYINNTLPHSKRKVVEAHIAECYHCLDMLTAADAGKKGMLKADMKDGFKKEYLYLVTAILSFTLSFLFSKYFLQFLAAAVILGIKWIVDSKSSKTLITVYETLKKDSRQQSDTPSESMDNKKTYRF